MVHVIRNICVLFCVFRHTWTRAISLFHIIPHLGITCLVGKLMKPWIDIVNVMHCFLPSVSHAHLCIHARVQFRLAKCYDVLFLAFCAHVPKPPLPATQLQMWSSQFFRWRSHGAPLYFNCSATFEQAVRSYGATVSSACCFLARSHCSLELAMQIAQVPRT